MKLLKQYYGEMDEKELETLIEIQYKALYKEFSLEDHLKTIERLPEEKREKHYNKLLRGGWISTQQYRDFTR